MWPTPDDLSMIAIFARNCWASLPTATTILRFATALTTFAIAVHRAIRYVRRLHR